MFFFLTKSMVTGAAGEDTARARGPVEVAHKPDPDLVTTRHRLMEGIIVQAHLPHLSRATPIIVQVWPWLSQ
jgi:hypothetical protein